MVQLAPAQSTDTISFHCSHCWDTGIATRDLKACICFCGAAISTKPAAQARLFECVSDRLRKELPVDPLMLRVARALTKASATAPIGSATLQAIIHINERSLKELMKRLRDEWRLPVCGSRRPPYGFFIAATPDEFLAWMRTTKSQAISELATAYSLFRSNFPALAGQAHLFVDECSHDLQEAIQ